MLMLLTEATGLWLCLWLLAPLLVTIIRFFQISNAIIPARERYKRYAKLICLLAVFKSSKCICRTILSNARICERILPYNTIPLLIANSSFYFNRTIIWVFLLNRILTRNGS